MVLEAHSRAGINISHIHGEKLSKVISSCGEPMVIWGMFSGRPWRHIPKFTMSPVFAYPIWNCSTALHNCMEFGFKGSKVESHRVNAGNDLGGQLGHNDDNDAGQQPGLQQQGLRVGLASWGFRTWTTSGTGKRNPSGFLPWIVVSLAAKKTRHTTKT